MEKMIPAAETPPKSTDNKKEIFLPVLEESRRSFLDSRENPNNLLELTVFRKKPNGSIETLEGLAVMEIHDNGPEFCLINKEGNSTGSVAIPWEEIFDIEKEN